MAIDDPSSSHFGAFSGNFPAIVLPEPRLDGLRTMGDALRARCTTREYLPDPLPPQMLSDLLWSACGVNRKIGPFGLTGRTDASASNSQEIDVFVALEGGVYLYEEKGHRLAPILVGDHRPLVIGAGQSRSGDHAAVRLIFVADVDRLEHSAGFDEPGLHDPEVQKSYYYVDCGLVAGNVYLYAASVGLAAWFHNCDRPALSKKLPLRAGRRVLFGQTVGFPRTPLP